MNKNGTQNMHNYQDEVMHWGDECFGKELNWNKSQRNHRFIEEALELVQACNMSKKDVLMLVDYVYSREIGEIAQEVGGTVVSLAALCATQDINMFEQGEKELARVWTKIPEIKAKQRTKPHAN